MVYVNLQTWAIFNGRVDEYPDERIVLRAYRKHRQSV